MGCIGNENVIWNFLFGFLSEVNAVSGLFFARVMGGRVFFPPPSEG